MLYTIIALAVIFANMYLTSKLTFTCRPDTPDYDYRAHPIPFSSIAFPAAPPPATPAGALCFPCISI